MARIILIAAALSAVYAAPPQRLYQHPSQIQHLNPLDYYLDSQEGQYYQQEQKPAPPNSSPARLETLEPDSEVELIPGAQPPQQPPQQTPVAPNIPGLIPGQRVFIVHMPVPGIRPGTVGGYQPVYIVAAAPQANAAYPGYQNTVLVSPNYGQPGAPAGYPMPGVQGNPNLVFSATAYNRPFGLALQEPVNYQQIPAQQFVQVPPSAINFAQLVSLQGQQAQPAQEAKVNDPQNAEQKSASQVTIDSKETAVNQKSAKSTHGLIRNKA
ncbi:calcium-binding protein P [Bicyclus anynana]|uniref:Calcium-binding protein P n=1 Tax=Bicyclus anynana TaxID=110368 RepID=A0A6J1MY22_BICAN|nr:calcium-binding protein P [Bicyclus anynana]